MTHTVTSRDGTTIAYDQVGSGPALILVDAASCFRGFGPMPELAAQVARDFTVLTYDRRGRGESTDTVPYAVDREVDDLRALVEAAGGSAFAYGFSSGAVLALHAAASGVAIRKLVLLEPPIELDGEPDTVLGAEVAELAASGRRREAFEHFQTACGVPEEMVAGMRQSPSWPALEALAHTLAYDCAITATMAPRRLSTITTPTLVLHSEGSDARLVGWARGIADALPDGTCRGLKGEWHGIPASTLGPVLTEFFTGPNRLETPEILV